jgi:anti-sigma regulatory factor (Ser/Thr protein kinase)
MRFSSTPRGVRLARHLALERLHAWGLAYDAPTARAVELIVGELCANAVQHGAVAGRDFELRLSIETGTARVEVSDARHEAFPPTGLWCPPQAGEPPESGYGLRLVAALADRWGAHPRAPIGKTVWATVPTPEATAPEPARPSCALYRFGPSS